MIIINTTDGSKFWTEQYHEKDGFISFDIVTKMGKVQQYQVNKNQIVSIADVGKIEPKQFGVE